MAFIRWKKTTHGTWKAYLVHSYRDELGRPRHKTLAYLGNKPTLKEEHLSTLKALHGHLKVNWEKIRPAANPPLTDISAMSDEDFLRQLRTLRRERGITVKEMRDRLRQGTAQLYGTHAHFCQFERTLEVGDLTATVGSRSANELVPYLREILE